MSSGTRTSELLWPLLVDQCGEIDAKLVAADLDQAVYEFGHFIEGKIRSELDRYQNELRSSYHRRVRSWQQSGSHGNPPEPPPIDQTRVRELQTEVVSYWVHGLVIVHVDTMGDDPTKPGGRAYFRKKAKYDWTDMDMGTDDVETVWLD